jgi:hypothetical protein
VSFAAINLCVASQRVFTFVVVVYFVVTQSGNFWIYPRTYVSLGFQRDSILEHTEFANVLRNVASFLPYIHLLQIHTLLFTEAIDISHARFEVFMAMKI